MQKQSFERDSPSPEAGQHESFIEERKEILEELFDRVEKYVHLNVEIYKLRAIEGVAEVLSSTIANILIALVAIIFFLMLNVGAAIWIGGLLEAPAAGYFLLSGLYLIILVILWILRKNLFKKSIVDSFIKQFAKD